LHSRCRRRSGASCCDEAPQLASLAAPRGGAPAFRAAGRPAGPPARFTRGPPRGARRPSGGRAAGWPPQLASLAAPPRGRAGLRAAGRPAHERCLPAPDRVARRSRRGPGDLARRHLCRRHLRPRRSHSRALLQRLDGSARLIAFDKDPDAIGAAAQGEAPLASDPRFTIVHASFGDMGSELRARGITQVDGVLLDLGVSSPQIDTPARGFSFRLRRAAGHAHGHDPRRDRRGLPGPRRRARHCNR
jgi:hypothetical protein